VKEWLFEPLDTLFFRSGLSIDAADSGGTGWVESIFPPTPQTMQGAIRSSVLISECHDPKVFGEGGCSNCAERESCSIPAKIGSTSEGDYGNLDLYGPYLFKDDNCYYTIPLDIVREKEGEKRLFTLKPSETHITCDLGKVCMPAKPTGSNFGAFDLVEGWIKEEALINYLQGDKDNPISGDDLVTEDLFFEREPRVGIKRDYSTHRVITGMLYSIIPLRFNAGSKIGVRVGGIDNIDLAGYATNIGGEGKVCRLDLQDCEERYVYKLDHNNHVKMVLLQPADFGGNWYPSEFKEKDLNGTTCWERSIEGVNIKLRLITACIGKPYKLGGWNMAERRVKPMKNYIPAGSVYFFEVVEGDASDLPVEGKIGNNSQIGFGHYLLGTW